MHGDEARGGAFKGGRPARPPVDCGGKAGVMQEKDGRARSNRSVDRSNPKPYDGTVLLLDRPKSIASTPRPPRSHIRPPIHAFQMGTDKAAAGGGRLVSIAEEKATSGTAGYHRIQDEMLVARAATVRPDLTSTHIHRIHHPHTHRQEGRTDGPPPTRSHHQQASCASSQCLPPPPGSCWP